MRTSAAAPLMLLLMMLLQLDASTAAGPTNITLLWCSDPIRPNETLMVQYGSDAVPLPDPSVLLKPLSGGQQAVLTPSLITNHTVAFVLPPDTSVDAYEVTVTAGGATSNTIVANKPAVWWVQGDGGKAATAGGWLRAFGHGLALPLPENAHPSPRLALRQLTQGLASAAQRSDWSEAAELAAHAAALASKQQSAAARALATTLTLTPMSAVPESNAHPTPIVIKAVNATEYAAWFPIPEAVPPAQYHVSISNGAASGELDSYYDHLHPRVMAVQIKQRGANAWGSKVVRVTDAGCAASLTNYSDQIDCTQAMLSAIETLNGTGGTVQLGLGRFYVRGPLLLPNGVRLRGAGMGRTGLYFASMNASVSTPRSLITNSQPGRFGLEDMDIYVLAFYVNVIHISVDTDGVEIRRVRLRANAFHCQNGDGRRAPYDLKGNCDYSLSGKPCLAPWPYKPQPAIMLLGRNYVITGCDLWATWNVLYSGLTAPAQKPGADQHDSRGPWINSEFGRITNNELWNGGNCHWFDSIHQLIYEGNTCTGNSPMAGGNNLATYSGDATHHLYLANNIYKQAYGNDRETMTYDDFGSAYYGGFIDLQTQGDTTILRTPGGNRTVVGGKKQNDVVNFDKAIVIVNGSGAGQYRRLIDWHWATDQSEQSSWRLDRPFAYAPDPDALIAIIPFRGRNIFYQNEHSDSGAFQFYGVGIENLVVELTGTRMGGFIAVGMGGDQGINPNLYNQFLGVTITEGLRADHREESLLAANFTAPTPQQQRCLGATGNNTLKCGIGFEFGDRLAGLAEVNSFSIMPDGVCSQNQFEGEITQSRFIVFRRNRVESNGGFFLNGGADLILEHNAVSDFEPGFSAAPLTRGGNYGEQPLASPPPFAITNISGHEGCPSWGCNKYCRGAVGVVARGNTQE